MTSTSRLSVPMSVNVQFCFFSFSMSVLTILRLYSSEQFSSPSVILSFKRIKNTQKLSADQYFY